MMLTILQGDALEKLRELPGESVQCCVTSPPYWGLRDYGTAKWDGGDDNCDHRKRDAADAAKRSTLGPNRDGLDANNQAHSSDAPFKTVCGKCGANRIDSQIGLEETQEAYMAKIVEVFREVRRVLKNDATLWLNLGDSYASAGYIAHKQSVGVKRGGCSSWNGETRGQGAMRTVGNGIKPKDLCGMPWRVAFALQADGWYLRSDIIWSKPNPMPESVTDRPTKSHEYLFLLTKSDRYYYDAGAIAEPVSESMMQQVEQGYNGHATKLFEVAGAQDASATKSRIIEGARKRAAGECLTRNKRSVWTVPTAPYSEAHFATYPPDLIKPCILAGTKAGDTVLDPFAGSGTTGMVAVELGRKAILIELNPQYIPLIEQRCNITPGFAI